MKPYCLTVKTYTANTATGKLSRKNIRISSNKQDLSQQEVSLPVSECLPNVNSEKFVANDLGLFDDRESYRRRTKHKVEI